MKIARNRKILAIIIATLCIASSSLIGCALFGPAPKAEVFLVDLSFTDATLFETTAEAVVRVENQNPDPISVLGGVHRIAVNGTELGSGTSSDTLELEPYASGTQRVTFHLSNLSMFTKIKSLIESQIFQYDIESEIPVRMNGIRRRVDLERSGRVEPKDFQGN